MNYEDIASAVNWAGVLTGLGVVAIALAGLLVAQRGARTLLDFIRR